MTNLIDLQIAVLDEDIDETQSLIREIDRRTESDVYSKAAAHFGFKTIEHLGRQFAMRAEVAHIFGYKGESGLRMLCERYQIETVSMGSFAQNVRIKIREELKLPEKDGKTVFIGWDAFLLAAMESKTPQAKAVKSYLLKMERAGRVAAGALDFAKERNDRIKQTRVIVQLIGEVDRIKDQRFRQVAAEHVDDLLDGALGVTKQPDLFAPTSN